MFDDRIVLSGQPYYPCPECGNDGFCMGYGHFCGSLRCSEKPDEYQPLEDCE